jgi:hypothetical protein
MGGSFWKTRLFYLFSFLNPRGILDLFGKVFKNPGTALREGNPFEGIAEPLNKEESEQCQINR